jgi:hypothetical protein
MGAGQELACRIDRIRVETLVVREGHEQAFIGT